MTFEEICTQKGGVFKRGVGCLLPDASGESKRFNNDFPLQNGMRLFYQTTKTECEKNGDEFVKFELDFLSPSMKVCKELGPSEVCERDVNWHKKHDIAAIGEETRLRGWEDNYRSQLEACTKSMQFSDKKIDKLLNREDSNIIIAVIRNQKLSSALINKVIDEKPAYLSYLFGVADSDEKNAGKPYQHLSSENIDKALAQDKGLADLYSHHKLSQKQLAKAIEKGKDIRYVYQGHTLDANNIELAIEKGEDLGTLFQHQKLSSEQVTKAIENPHISSVDVASLYEHQRLTEEQIDKAIDSGKSGIYGLCRSKKNRLNQRQINKVINMRDYGVSRQRDLRALYEHYTLTPKQVDYAIAKGLAIDMLIQKQNITDAQIKHIIKTCEGEELWALYSKKWLLSPEQVDLALAENQNYIAMLYQYQKMTPKQIDKALDIGINREAIYAHQKLQDEQITKAIKYELKEQENDLQLRQLFSNQKFNDSHIDYIIKNSVANKNDATIRMFMDHQPRRLNKKQIKDVIDFAGQQEAKSRYESTDIINTLFDSQEMNAETIDYCIEKDVSLQLIYNSYGELFRQQNVKKALSKGKYYSELFTNVKLTTQQITEALEKGQEIPALIKSQANMLNQSQIQYLIESGEEANLRVLYSTYHATGDKKRIDYDQIDMAIKRGAGLDELYDNNILLPRQIDSAIQNGHDLYHLYCNHGNTLTVDNYKHAIRVNAELENLFTCRKDLPPEIVDYALEEGHGLHELYEHQQLNEKQLTKALEMGEDLPQLYVYQIKNFTPAHFDVLIPNADENLLYKLYTDTSLRLSDAQREAVAKKLSDELGHIIPPSSVVHTRLLPKYWKEYEEKKQRALDNRIKDRPLESLIGVYPLSVENPWDDILKYAKKKGFSISEDGKYAFDKNDSKKQVRLGKLLFRELKSEQDPLMKKYKVLMSQKIRPSKYTSEKLPKEQIENLEIVISNDPNDLAAKGTGHEFINEGCETVQSGGFGWNEWTPDELAGKAPVPRHGCGWCDDIKYNNLVVYLRNKTEKDPRKKWFDRAMIRWCIRDDDKKPDAVLETVYGKDHYKPMLREVVTKILNKNGFTGTTDGHVCITPYKYTGYADHATSRTPYANGRPDLNKVYKLDERPLVRT